MIAEEARGHRPGDPLPGVPLGSMPACGPLAIAARKRSCSRACSTYRKIAFGLARPEELAVRDADAIDLQRARIRMNEGKPRRD